MAARALSREMARRERVKKELSLFTAKLDPWDGFLKLLLAKRHKGTWGGIRRICKRGKKEYKRERRRKRKKARSENKRIYKEDEEGKKEMMRKKEKKKKKTKNSMSYCQSVSLVYSITWCSIALQSRSTVGRIDQELL